MNNNNTPKRRFKEFENAEAWEQRKLGELYIERNERGNDNLQILSVSIHTGVSDKALDEETLGKFVKRSEDKSTYKHVYAGDLIFNMMRAWQGAIGVAKNEGMISPAYISAIPNDEVYPLFMDYALRRDSAIAEINNLSYGVTDFRKRLYWDSFVKVGCKIPSVNEQRKIYDYFKNLDNLITLHQRKLDKLKKVKSAYLDEMFPKEGEKYPRRRFKGFSEPWEQRKLEECVDRIATGLNPRDNFKLNTGGTNYYVTIKNFEHGHLFLDDRCDKVDDDALKKIQERSDLQKDDILFTSIGRVGDCYLIESTPNNWNINESVFSLRPNQSVVIPEYLFQTIHCDVVLSQILNNITGSTFKSIKIGDLKKASIPVPNKEEQRKIGSFISNLDNLITLHQRKLDKLKRVKSAYLEEMFV